MRERSKNTGIEQEMAEIMSGNHEVVGYVSMPEAGDDVAVTEARSNRTQTEPLIPTLLQAVEIAKRSGGLSLKAGEEVRIDPIVRTHQGLLIIDYKGNIA